MVSYDMLSIGYLKIRSKSGHIYLFQSFKIVKWKIVIGIVYESLETIYEEIIEEIIREYDLVSSLW